MSSKDVTISGADGDFMGYLASPEGGGTGVIVIQEIFGVNAWLRGVCDMLAEHGFMALAPDLFWRIEPGVQLDATKEAEFNKGLDLYGKFNVQIIETPRIQSASFRLTPSVHASKTLRLTLCHSLWKCTIETP